MIKLFEQYNDYNQVKKWLDKMYIKLYTINDDLTVDVYTNVSLMHYGLTELPIQFGKVIGYFDCSRNKLTTLKGCPTEVGDYFTCSHNELTSLEYSPKSVVNSFYCLENGLTTLKGSPEYIGGDFYASENPLINLINNTKELKGKLFLMNCVGLPIEIKYFSNFNNFNILLKHQDEYGIWNSDGSFNKARFDIFLQDYESGILK